MWTGLTFSDPAEAGTAKAAPRINQHGPASRPIVRTPSQCFFPAVIDLVGQADGDRIGVAAGRNTGLARRNPSVDGVGLRRARTGSGGADEVHRAIGVRVQRVVE